MGAYAPAPCLPPYLQREATEQVLKRCVDALQAEGAPYCGVLYAGLMLTQHGLYVLEFNCRFGDPETEVLLPLLQTDLFDIMQACCAGRLADLSVQWAPQTAVTVVAASRGYPGSYAKGLPITGLPQAAQQPGVTVFHAGTRASEVSPRARSLVGRAPHQRRPRPHRHRRRADLPRGARARLRRAP